MADKTPVKSTKVAKKAAAKPVNAKPTLLSGGNPQIAKGYGDAAVEAYIAAMPGWKRDVGRRLDALITQTVPGVRKAVKWNSPLYGVGSEGDDNGWFLGVHCFTKYVKQWTPRNQPLSSPSLPTPYSGEFHLTALRTPGTVCV